MGSAPVSPVSFASWWFNLVRDDLHLGSYLLVGRDGGERLEEGEDDNRVC